MIHPLDIIATIPLKGRDSHAEPMKKRPKTAMQIDTPTLPFDTQPIKIRRTVLPSRPNTALSGQPMGERMTKMDGSYSKKFTDSTWASNDVATRDRSPTRDDIKSLDFKFEKNIEMVAGYKGVELAQRLQAVNDMLLDELIIQFRVLNLGQGKLLEKSRAVYAQVFQILDDDAEKSAKTIVRLKKVATKAEEEKNKALEEAKIRIAQVKSECQNKVEEANAKLELKMQEFDENMKNFLDQKAQLEEHVKALHHVFLDFQSDAVYLTLEQLKSQLSSANGRVEKKEEANLQLQSAIAKWKQQYQELTDTKKQLEEANASLRQQLQAATNKNSQLLRQIDILRADLEAAEEVDDQQSTAVDETEEELRLLGDSAPMVNQLPEANQAPSHMRVVTPIKRPPRNRGMSFSNRNGNTTPFIVVYQKLCQMGTFLSQFIERSTGRPVMWNDQNIDEDEMQLLQKDVNKTERIIEQKIDKVIMIADCLNQIDGKEGKKDSGDSASQPRFLQYFSRGISSAAPQQDTIEGGNDFEKPNIFCEVRKIFQAKYLHDKWNQRANLPLLRFPEFVVLYYYKDDKRVGSALHMCKRLWKNTQEIEVTEVKLFRDFLEEKLTLDELTFFLEMRNGLLGTPFVANNDPPSILIPYEVCKELMNRVLGAFSPIASLVGDEASALVENGTIDYSVFLNVFLNFYANEREKRKSAVKLMIQSRKYSADSDTPIVLEMFVSILQSLGYQGTFEQVMELYREARIISGGDITLEGLLRTMDEMNIHFYSIDMSMNHDISFERSESLRQMIMSHYAKFGQWFEGLRRTATTLDSWVKAKLIYQVRRVDQTFQLGHPPSTLYGELRNLLDLFQFVLGLLARGSPVPMKAEHSEKQLELLEDLNEMLLKFVINAGSKQLQSSHKK